MINEFQWQRVRLFKESFCKALLDMCMENSKATIIDVSSKRKSKWRPTPMNTVELEKLGSRKLKLSAKKTMTIAEKLYSQGLISYPRTETNIFSKEIDLVALVEAQVHHPEWGSFAQRILSLGPNPRNGKSSDQAHPPIHPLKIATSILICHIKAYI